MDLVAIIFPLTKKQKRNQTFSAQKCMQEYLSADKLMYSETHDWSSELYTSKTVEKLMPKNNNPRPDLNSNPWPRRNQYSALPTELSSHLGADHSLYIKQLDYEPEFSTSR